LWDYEEKEMTVPGYQLTCRLALGMAQSYLQVADGHQMLPPGVKRDPDLRAAYAAFSMKASIALVSFANIEQHPVTKARMADSPRRYANALLPQVECQSRWKRLSAAQRKEFYQHLFEAAVTYCKYQQILSEGIGRENAEALLSGASMYSDQSYRKWPQEVLRHSSDLGDTLEVLQASRRTDEATFDRAERKGYRSLGHMYQALLNAPASQLDDKLMEFFRMFAQHGHWVPLV
jgi:hypothetical protein